MERYIFTENGLTWMTERFELNLADRDLKTKNILFLRIGITRIGGKGNGMV